MKKLLFLCISLSLSSCWYYGGEDDYEYTSNYEPITVARSDFHQRISLENSQPITNSGKIYIKDTYLFLMEPGLGIHVFDNADRSNPMPLHFIPVEGVTDIAIKNSLIYVHHLTDLVVLDYRPNINSLTLINVTENAFPALSSPDGFDASFFQVSDDLIITGYQLI